MTAPALQSVTQTNSSTIVLHFDRAMSSGDGTIVVSDGYSQAYFSGSTLLNRIIGANDTRSLVLSEGYNMSGDDGQVSYSGNDVTLTLSSALKAGVGYSVTMNSGALYADGSGDFGIASTTLYKFTVSGGTTPSAPGATVGSAIHFIDNGASSSDYITGISAQTVTGTYTGTLGSNDFVQVSLDNGASWHKATASGNTWSYVGGIETAHLASVSGGLAGVMLARVSNTSALSTATASQGYVYNGVDANTAALTGHAVSLSSGSDSGAFDDDGITQEATSVDVNVSGLHGFHVGDTVRILDTSHGSAEVGHYVIQSGDLYYGSGDYISVSYGNSGFRDNLNVTLDEPLSSGVHSLVAVMVDKDGVVSSAVSNAGAVTVDTVAPVLASSSPDEDGTVGVDLNQLAFTFDEDIAVEDGTIVTITDLNNPNSTQEVTLHSSDVSGHTLTITLTGTLNSDTDYEVKGAIISDLAGNVGVTGDAPLLHFNTGHWSPQPSPAPTLSFTDTAPASDVSDSARHSDHITKDATIYVEGLAMSGSTWKYSLDGGGTWLQGDGVTFQLDPASYAAGQIQVQEFTDGVPGDIGSNATPITLRVSGPTALQDNDQTSGFISGGTQINGHMHGSTDLPNEIVEVTLDGGVTWLAAATTSAGAGAFTWNLSLGSSGATLADAVGVRVVDQTGTPGAFPSHGTATQYYLANDDATYTDTSGASVVFGGTGADTITLGTGSYVIGNGGADHIITGADSEVHTGSGDDTITVGARSDVDAGGGNNVVNATSGASDIATGAGADLINLGTNFGSVGSVTAGAGTDTLAFSSATTVSLTTLVNVSGMTGIDVLQLGGTTTIDLGASGAAVTALSDANHLTINGTSSNHVQMGTSWSYYSSDSSYVEYHNQDGAVVLIAVAMAPSA
jgi:hypothetical protein